jgi:hypothetical protein
VELGGDLRVAFAHIDCDWFDPVMLCLEQTYRCLSPGGIVILDDYNEFGGCRRATEAFLAGHADMPLIDATHNAMILKEVVVRFCRPQCRVLCRWLGTTTLVPHPDSDASDLNPQSTPECMPPIEETTPCPR